jgi:hypothetical protein
MAACRCEPHAPTWRVGRFIDVYSNKVDVIGGAFVAPRYLAESSAAVGNRLHCWFYIIG